MTLGPGTRRFVLTAHVISSVGWLGAAISYLALAIAALVSGESRAISSTWFALELIGWYVIVPLALASLVIGLVQSLSTPWGLFRHYWVLIKFLLTVFATIILVLHMPTVSYFTDLLGASGEADTAGLWGEVLHAGGGLLVLLVNTGLSVYKPRGLTPYGWRRQYEQPTQGRT